MKGQAWPVLAWGILALLAALAVTNVALLILLRVGGPLIGAVFYAFLLALAWRRRPRDYRAAMAGGLVGLAVHAVEIAIMGWSACPAWMVLNLILPAPLALLAWLAGRQARRKNCGQ
jgi:hypothetical protein